MPHLKIPVSSCLLIGDEVASYGGPSSLARRLNEAAAKWTAQGELDFLNTWWVYIGFSMAYLSQNASRTYKLGEEGGVSL